MGLTVLSAKLSAAKVSNYFYSCKRCIVFFFLMVNP